MPDTPHLRRQEYIRRVNRALDYIRENPTGDLRLETVARAAHFSPFHFHRVFRAVSGETLNDYIRRTRVQRAAEQLIRNPTRSISQIAAGCGYSSPSSFAREFREWFGTSASQFREGGSKSVVRLRERLEARGESFTHPADRHLIRTQMVFDVAVRSLPDLHVAYVRHKGRYDEIGRAFQRLLRWAHARELDQAPDARVLGVYYSSPEVTPVAQLLSDACISVPVGTGVSGEIGLMTIPGGRFAVAHVEIGLHQYSEAWDRLIGDWMPESGYQPDDRLCYEIYLNDPDTHPDGKHIVELCEPIRPL